jgi:hypothetical protein
VDFASKANLQAKLMQLLPSGTRWPIRSIGPPSRLQKLWLTPYQQQPRIGYPLVGGVLSDIVNNHDGAILTHKSNLSVHVDFALVPPFETAVGRISRRPAAVANGKVTNQRPFSPSNSSSLRKAFSILKGSRFGSSQPTCSNVEIETGRVCARICYSEDNLS